MDLRNFFSRKQAHFEPRSVSNSTNETEDKEEDTPQIETVEETSPTTSKERRPFLIKAQLS